MMPAVTAENRPSFWWARWVPAAALLIAFIALIIAIGGTVLIPLALSFALTFMLEPITDWFQRRGYSRSLSAILTLLGATAVVLLVLFFLLPSIWHQLSESIEKLPLALQAATGRLRELLAFAQANLSSQLFEQLTIAVADFQDDPSALTSHIGEWLSQGAFGLVGIGSAALGLAIVPFFVYYLLLDMNNLRRLIDEHIPARHRGVGVRLFDEVGEVVRGYVRGRFFVAACMSVVYAAGLLIMGVPLWAAIGLIAGFIGIIPYLGVLSGVILALGFAALDGAGAGRLSGVLVVFIVAQMIEDYVLTPRLIGNKLELHPMLVFIALIVAGDLFGLLGLVLAIPVIGVVKVVVRFFDELYLRSGFYLASAPVDERGGATTVQKATAATISEAAKSADKQEVIRTREEIHLPGK